MKNLILFVLLYLPGYLFAQLGIKAGINFANVTKASSINNNSRTGFHAGIFLAPRSKGIFGSHTELLFSRQGYEYKTNTNTGTVDLDYIVLPQLTAINITKFVQIQVGAQVAYLLNAKVDSTVNNNSGGSNPYSDIMDLYNRFDFGLGFGLQVHPVSGLVIGARFNISFVSIYKDPSSYGTGSSDPSYDFIPKPDITNNVFQIYVGWRFDKQGTSSEKKKQ